MLPSLVPHVVHRRKESLMHLCPAASRRFDPRLSAWNLSASFVLMRPSLFGCELFLPVWMFLVFWTSVWKISRTADSKYIASEVVS